MKQPVMSDRVYKASKNCNKVADDVMKNGILIGCHQGMKKRYRFNLKIFSKFLNKWM